MINGKNMKFLFLIFSLFFVSNTLFSEEIEFLQPQKIKATKDESSILEIKSNIFGADVYINEVYLGKTNLTIMDYLPGNYYLQISKNGYETKKFQLEIQKGYHQTYYIDLNALYVNLSLSNIDADSLIYIDGRKVSFEVEEIKKEGQQLAAGDAKLSSGEKKDKSVEVENTTGEEETLTGEANQLNPQFFTNIKIPIGNHELLVRKFGCKDFYSEINIQRDETLQLEVKNDFIDFEIKNFEVSKKSFNPEYKNSVGSVTFSFAVTANEPLSFYIKNENDEIVFNYDWKELHSWYQSIVWDGKDSEGNILPDGDYVASIQSRHFIFNQPVKIDTTISYPLFSICDNGIGIGDLPAIFADICLKDSDFGKNITLPYFQVKPISKVTGDNSGFVAVKSNVGFVTTIKNNYEFNFGLSLYPGLENGGLSLNGSFKMAYAYKLGNFFSLTYGGLLRYGFTNAALYSDYIDNGSGVGLGGLVGLDSKIIKMELSSQFFIREKFLEKENPDNTLFYSLWKNGISISVKPVNVLGLYSWFALENLDALDFGAGINIMPVASSVLFDFNFKTSILFNSSSYLTFGIMLSYLF